MNATYRLSARQRKELIERGTCLHLAIPAPPRRDYDPLAFARLALPEVKGLIVSAEEREVSVRPQPNRLGRWVAAGRDRAERRGPAGRLDGASGGYHHRGTAGRPAATPQSNLAMARRCH